MPRSVIYRMFTNPFYYGWFEYPKGSGELYSGKHEPMITQAEYDRVQILLAKRGNPRPQLQLEFAFTGLIKCGECGNMVTAEEKHQMICGNCHLKFAYRKRDACPRCQTSIDQMTCAKFLRYTYYHCSKSKKPRCTQKILSGEEIEKQIEAYISRIQISPRFRDWAVKFLHELHEKEIEARNNILQAQQKAYQECLRQIDNLVKLKTSPNNADGSMLSDDEYARQRLNLVKKKSALEELLGDTGHRVERWLKLSEQTFDFACTARTRFAEGDTKTKKQILSTIGSNLTLKDKILSIEAKKPFFILENSVLGPKSEIVKIEPEIIGLPQLQKEATASLSPTLGANRHDVRTLRHRNENIVKAIYHFFQSFTGAPSEIFPGWSAGEETIDYSTN